MENSQCLEEEEVEETMDKAEEIMEEVEEIGKLIILFDSL